MWSFVALVLAAFAAPALIAVLKGRGALVVLGFVFGSVVLWTVLACRLAKPDSWWYNHRYSTEMQDRSEARFPSKAYAGAYRSN